MNYFIIAGAALMYTSIFFYLLPSTDENVVWARCIVSIKRSTITSYYSIELLYFVTGRTLVVHHWLFTCFWSSISKNVEGLPSFS